MTKQQKERKKEQAGAELGQAQLKLEFGALWLKFIATNMIRPS